MGGPEVRRRPTSSGGAKCAAAVGGVVHLLRSARTMAPYLRSAMSWIAVSPAAAGVLAAVWHWSQVVEVAPTVAMGWDVKFRERQWQPA
jgi:hypothetical protein